MDKIAVISDIHGNIPALEAVLSDIKNRKIERIFCLGDIAGKGPSTCEALDIVMNRCEIVTKGNWEHLISEDPVKESFQWYRNQLSEEELIFLKSLPMYHEFYISGRLTRICHAAPFSVFHRVQFFACAEEKLELFSGVDGGECSILGYGDIHWGYVEKIGDRTIFNAGSVGNPLDFTLASYTILEGDYNSKLISNFNINIIRVPYDIDKAVAQALEGKVPEVDLYIKELRTAKFRGIKDA